MNSILKLGTRGSPLAIAQSRMVKAEIEQRIPGQKVQEVIIHTTGDKLKEIPFSEVGTKGIFIKEIEEALIREEIDFAVHSLKDLPTDIPEELFIVAYGKKEERNDGLISIHGYDLKSLPFGAKVGTSSLRRQSQLLKARLDLKMEEIRGNLDTRLRKLKEGAADAIVVAMAGISRLYGKNFSKDFSVYRIPFSEMLPCVGQGLLALEIRSNREDLKERLKFLNEEDSNIEARCERAFLKELGGSCRLPMAALARVQGAQLFLEGFIASPKGENSIRENMVGSSQFPEDLGGSLGRKFLSSEVGKRALEEIRKGK